MPYVGPAAALPLYGALARLPHPVAVRLWTALLVAAAAALAFAALGLARTRRPAAVLGALLLGFTSGPETSAIALGQVALIAAGGIACALLAFERRTVVAGAAGMLAAGLQPNLAIALLARLRDRTALTGASLAALAFAALALAGAGAAGIPAYAHRLGAHGAAESFVVIQHTPASIAWAFGAPAGVALTGGAICALAALALTLAATIRAKLDPLDGTLLALTALPFAVPFFHEHDFVVELVPLIVLALRARGAARAMTAVATALICVDWLNFAQRPEAAAQTVVLGLALACGFVLLGAGARATRTDLVPFAAVLALACIAVPLGRAHPAPVWPDALPAGYRAPAAADASAVWADEQRAAGLTARQPAWGALRALPLAGCIVLGFAVVRTGRRRSGTALNIHVHEIVERGRAVRMPTGQVTIEHVHVLENEEHDVRDVVVDDRERPRDDRAPLALVVGGLLRLQQRFEPPVAEPADVLAARRHQRARVVGVEVAVGCHLPNEGGDVELSIVHDPAAQLKEQGRVVVLEVDRNTGLRPGAADQLDA